MARGSRSWRDHRRATEGPVPLTEEVVETMQREGVLSKVVRLPVVVGAPTAPLPRPPQLGLAGVVGSPVGGAVESATGRAATGGAGAHGSSHGPRDLRLADGTRARVTPAGLVVGRRRSKPVDSDASSTPRLELEDESRSLSREHAHLVADVHGTVRVTDLDSGNGTTMRRPGGASVELVPGTPVTMAVGDVLHLGGTTASLQEGRPLG